AGFAQYNKEERENKDVLYKELLDAHKKLKQYSDEVNRLAVVEERNRIARDLHDTLGHNMTALIMQMEMAAHMLEEDGTEAGSLLEKAKKTARDSLSGIREVVETLRGRDDKTKGSQSIEELVKEFSMKTGVNIKLDLSGASGKLSPEAEGILFRIVQEALTNSVRHGKATEVEIVINCTGGGIEFYIKDNGEGTADYKEGYGMRGIREWVEAMKGKVEFLSRDGFAIKGSLKLEGGYDKRIDC
ncbi:MAG: sensor histidine kinase, partial [Caulobacteraceae bacterium]